MHRNVIVLEGGGAKGPYEMGVLEVLESKAGRSIKDFIKLFVTTSVGSVIGSFLCTGKNSVSYWSKLVLNEMENVFKKRSWFFPLPIYDKKNYIDIYKKKIAENMYMCELPIWFMCTSVDRCEPRAHFFKSWEDKDGSLPVVEAVTRSFSAPLFFGATIDEQANKIWMDGGMSYNNLPLMKAYIEILRQGWLKNGDSVHILAVGAGRPDNSVPFELAKKNNIINQTVDQLKKYIDISDGGLTREMSSREQVGNLKAIAEVTDNLTFQWIDRIIPKELDKMDNVKARYVYYNNGLKDGEGINISFFKL